MAGIGSNTVLDKGFLVLSTYNSSAAAGVTRFRCVKFGAGGTIDIAAADTDVCVGVVQENIDAAKVATAKATADVRVLGISKVYVTTAASIVLGSKVTPSTGGGVKLAATGDIPLGVCVGAPTTVSDGDIIDVLITPGMPVL